MGSNPIPRTKSMSDVGVQPQLCIGTSKIMSFRGPGNLRRLLVKSSTVNNIVVPLHFRYGYRILHKLVRARLGFDENWIGVKRVKGFPPARSAGIA